MEVQQCDLPPVPIACRLPLSFYPFGVAMVVAGMVVAGMTVAGMTAGGTKG